MNIDYAIASICHDQEQENKMTNNKEALEAELLDLLEIMWDGYENGTPCYEDYDAENGNGTPCGNAFQIDEETENKICTILNRERPVDRKHIRPLTAMQDAPEVVSGLDMYKMWVTDGADFINNLEKRYPRGIKIVGGEK